MRLTNDGIKRSGDWFDNLAGAKEQHPAVAASDEDAQEGSPTLYFAHDGDTRLEFCYAAATAGYVATAAELDTLATKEAAELALRHGFVALAETIELNDSAAA